MEGIGSVKKKPLFLMLRIQKLEGFDSTPPTTTRVSFSLVSSNLHVGVLGFPLQG
jgi:hypothetical protein